MGDPRTPQPPHGAVTARAAVDRGLDIAATVRDTASEVVRRRRDPARIAERRRLAAKRRLFGWSLGGLVLMGVGANGIAEIAGGTGSAASIGAMVLVVGLWVYCVIGSVQAARDLKARTRAARSLPPVGPARRAVAGSLRPVIARLDAYSDALRQSVGMIGLAGGPADSVQQLRDDTLRAADVAETRLRAKAAECTALLRAGTSTREASARLTGDIQSGVDGYGRLVAAASDAAAASARLAGAGEPDQLADLTDRLHALAAGMREITGE